MDLLLAATEAVRACCRARRRKAQLIAKLAMCTALWMSTILSRHYITRSDLVAIGQSPWVHIKTLRQDRSVLQLIGLTWESFDRLLAVFEPLMTLTWEAGRQGCASRHIGRQRILQPVDVLALALVWLHVPYNHLMLMLLFAVTPATRWSGPSDGSPQGNA